MINHRTLPMKQEKYDKIVKKALKDFPLKEEFVLSEKIREIGMKMAEEEQNVILKKYNLFGLNKEQIQGIADLVSYVNKVHSENKKEFIKRLKEEEPENWHEAKLLIDKLAGEELSNKDFEVIYK